MPSAREQTRTERRLAEVDALQQALAQLQEELTSYQEALRDQVAGLRTEAATERQKQTPARPAAAAMAANLATRPRASAQGMVPKPPPEPVEAPPPAPAAVPPAEPPRPAKRDSGVRAFLPQPPGKARETAQANAPLPPVKARDTAHGADALFAAPPPPPEPPPPLRSRETVHGGVQDLRRGGKPVSVLISDGLADSEPISGWVLDRWQTGLKIMVDEEVPVGLVLSVKPNKNEPGVQWLQISVKNCTPERNSYLLNCHFLERPPWSVLAMFAG